MQYVVRHLTRFVYSGPVSESVMELRMQPLELDRQRTLRFNVTTSQRAKMFAYRDHYGNAVHCFDIPGPHARLDVSVESAVDVSAAPTLPRQLPESAWSEFDGLGATAEHIDWLLPSPFTEVTPALQQFARAIGLDRRHDPLTTLRTLNATVFAQFAYEPRTTRVDSHIDEALRARAGVCQDFSHIMIALLRSIGIPARYVSGYIAPRESHQDRAGDNATHAWVEAFVPSLGWIGLDPTNNTIAGHRHIVVAIGRDYQDVPPTRGVFKGDAGSELSVAVSVAAAHSPIAVRELSPSVSWIVPPRSAAIADEDAQRQQQQQQQ
jgi:transglutaminase-like putative cysteine protease